ncbi:hypothetical protein NY537_14720 [Curtobacterium flaccumfaciens pv. betae]|uniref:hypothetical protein n=1 Tax=Curtobacterium flaccumfaciens TaxID=2035 RepID=UPI00265A2A11|nr:hypothetical protein [Curtobacterium flaccumfaciens]MCS5513994.1 hypothetical protein [Curtobacterium flaccumfaciens pv. betae]
MAGGFSIGVAADTKAFESAVKSGIIDPLDDAQDALEDLGKSGDKAGDGLTKGTRDAEQSLGKLGQEAKGAGRDVESGMKDAARSTDKLGDAGKDAGRDVEKGMRDIERAADKAGDAGRDAGDDIERGMKDAQRQTHITSDDVKAMARKIEAENDRIKQSNREAFDKAGSNTGEFKDEALQNFSEVTSSFQGDMSSITDLAQGTFGGLATLGGPASLAFGGLAVAAGLIGSALVQSGEDSDEFKEKIKDLADTKLGDLFSRYEDSGDDLAKGLRHWATDADTFGGSITDLQKQTRKGGLEFGSYADAIATQSVPKMKQMRREVEAQIKSLDKQASSQRAAGNGSSALANKYGEQADAARAVKKQLDDNLKVNDQYEKTLRSVAKAQGQTVEQYLATAEATATAEEANESLKDSMKSLAEQSAESTSDMLDNSALSAEQYIADTQKRQAADQQYYANLQAVGKAVPDEVYNYLASMGDSFSQELATYLAATPEQQAQILETWKKAAGSGTEVDGPTLKAKADASDVDKKTAEKGREKKAGPTSELKGDTKDVDRKVKEKSAQKADGPTAKLRADTTAVDRAIERYRNKTYNATVKFNADTSNVTAALNRLDGRHISVIVDQKPGKKVA